MVLTRHQARQEYANARMMDHIQKTFDGGKRKREWQVMREADKKMRLAVQRPVPHVSLRDAWAACQSELCMAAFAAWRRHERDYHTASFPCASRCDPDQLVAVARPHLCTTAFTVERNMVHDAHKVLAMAAAGSRTARVTPGYILVSNEVLFEPQAFLLLPDVLCAHLRSIKTLFVATEHEAAVLQPLFTVQTQVIDLLETPELVQLFKSEQQLRAVLRAAAVLFSKITHPASSDAVRAASLVKARAFLQRMPALSTRTPVEVRMLAEASHVETMPFASRRALAQRRNQLTGVDACGYYV